MKVRTILPALVCLIAAGCAATSPVVVGVTRPPISADQVKVYLSPPPVFEEVAVLHASSKSAFSPGGQRQMDKVLAQLKAQAAKLGANGVILEGFSDAETASLGTGVGSDSYSRHGSIALGVGGSFGIFKKTGTGRAIFVPPR